MGNSFDWMVTANKITFRNASAIDYLSDIESWWFGVRYKQSPGGIDERVLVHRIQSTLEYEQWGSKGGYINMHMNMPCVSFRSYSLCIIDVHSSSAIATVRGFTGSPNSSNSAWGRYQKMYRIYFSTLLMSKSQGPAVIMLGEHGLGGGFCLLQNIDLFLVCLNEQRQIGKSYVMSFVCMKCSISVWRQKNMFVLFRHRHLTILSLHNILCTAVTHSMLWLYDYFDKSSNW